MNKASNLLYPLLLNIIDKYQENYKGPDKMSREYMMKEIEKFKSKETV